MEVRFVNKKGVTLIELIIVMVIIAIGAVLFVPNLGPWLDNYRLRRDTRDVTSTLRMANMKAISTNLEYRVYFNSATRQYMTERGNQSSGSTNWKGDWDTNPAQNPAREGFVNDLHPGVTINFNGWIEFNPDSSCNSTTIILTNSKGRQTTITLIPSTGKVNVSF
jgi:prepilin-type N-terminal cleavage/methylation domain-containing protein